MLEKKIYQWKGINASGEKITRISQAKNKTHLRQILTHKNIILLSQRCIAKKGYDQRIRIKQIDDFLYRFYCLIKANISILDSLSLLLTTQSTLEMKGLIYRITIEIGKGKTLSDALKKFPKFFNTTLCTLIQISENSGRLHIALEKIIKQRNKIRNIQQKIKKTMTYPVFVLLISIIICVLLLNFAVPSFEKLYATFHVPLPLLTRIMLAASKTFQKNFFVFFSIIAFLIVSILTNKKRRVLKINYQNILIKIPGLKNIIHCYVVHYWCYSIAETTKAGLPLLKSLLLAEKCSAYLFYQKKFQQVSAFLEKGDLLHKALNKINIFQKDILGLIQIAEQSGNLNEILSEIANQYHTRLHNSTEKLNKLVEPILTLIVAFIIGVLVIALYWPIFNLGNLF